MKLESWPAKTYAYTLPMRYKLWGEPNDKVVLCMHGYQDHAQSMMKRIGWLDNDKLPFQVLAVNGPFPVPIWTASGFHEAYAWYFRDTERGFTIVSPEQMAERVAQLTEELNLHKTPLVIFGFSQGGYLAPFVTRLLPQTKAIIALGSGFPKAPYAHVPTTTKIYAIHGDRDERIPIQPTKEAHAQLLQQGFQGEFFAIPGLDHRVDTQVEPLVRKLAIEALK
jgi:phospholipase/carboxylesterase